MDPWSKQDLDAGRNLGEMIMTAGLVSDNSKERLNAPHDVQAPSIWSLSVPASPPNPIVQMQSLRQ